MLGALRPVQSRMRRGSLCRADDDVPHNEAGRKPTLQTHSSRYHLPATKAAGLQNHCDRMRPLAARPSLSRSSACKSAM